MSIRSNAIHSMKNTEIQDTTESEKKNELFNGRAETPHKLMIILE